MTNSAVIILGMHRSGTSALTGSLGILGLQLGDSMRAPHPGVNAKGYWEHLDILRVHDRLLAYLGSSWDDVRPLPDGWGGDPRVAVFREEIVRILRRDFTDVPVWGLKDPRLCRLLPLWQGVFRDLGTEPYYILTHRHPWEVALSLRRRDGILPAKAALLTLNHQLEAEKWTRGQRRVFTGFASLLADPEGELKRMASELEFAYPRRVRDVSNELQEFLTPTLRHHRCTQDPQAPEFGRWGSLTAAMYHALEAAGRGETEQTRREFRRLEDEWSAQLIRLDPALAGHITDLQERAQAAERAVDEVFSSPSWWVTKPLRFAVRLTTRTLRATRSAATRSPSRGRAAPTEGVAS